MTLEEYRRKRAEARRSVLGSGEDYNGMTPAAAFNAAWDMLSTPPPPEGYDPALPNHYYADSLGDPATCTEAHNHP